MRTASGVSIDLHIFFCRWKFFITEANDVINSGYMLIYYRLEYAYIYIWLSDFFLNCKIVKNSSTKVLVIPEAILRSRFTLLTRNEANAATTKNENLICTNWICIELTFIYTELKIDQIDNTLNERGGGREESTHEQVTEVKSGRNWRLQILFLPIRLCMCMYT